MGEAVSVASFLSPPSASVCLSRAFVPSPSDFFWSSELVEAMPVVKVNK